MPATGGAGGGAGALSGGAAGSGNAAGTAGTGGASGGGAGGADAGATSGGAAGIAGDAGMGAAGSGAGGAAGTSGSAGGAGVGSGTLTLSGFKIDPNPNMTISCFVSWTTTEAASSEVDFGEGAYAFRIRDATPVTDHRVLVIGMHAQKTYQIKAVSDNATGSGNAEGTFMTGALPNALPVAMQTVAVAGEYQPGWTLTNVQPPSSSALAVMYDEGGIPVWYFVQGPGTDSRGDVSTDLLENSVVVGATNGVSPKEVDFSGKVLWTGPANSNAQLMSHFTHKLPTGNYVVNREIDKSVMNGNTRIDDQRLEELTATNSVVWSWNLFDHIPPSGSREELCHGNALTRDDAAGIFYYNCRFVGLFKVDKASGDMLWRLGGTYDKTSLGPGDFTFVPPESQFSDAHDPEIHADGTILLYDNGGYAGLGGGNSNFHSRVVEYKIDETAKTATRTWEFPGSFNVDAWYKNTWYAPFWGDADVLPNGNILITAGVRSGSASTRIFEVTRAGKVVWEIVLPANNGSFQAERLSPPPLVETLP